ncbi:MAG TPA: hypothetical protein VM754_00755 [Actinomycetota bacterium]|nr:hypothetical protein [Actinomycetota bacterium]
MSPSRQTSASKKNRHKAEGGESSRPGPDENRGLKRNRTPFEWGLLATALVVIGTMVIGLFVYADKRAGGQAELRVEVRDTGRQHEGGPEVQLTVRNTGGAGAEQVTVEVQMGPEVREVTMIRIPKDDELTATVIFPAGTSGTPEAELLSYVQP